MPAGSIFHEAGPASEYPLSVLRQKDFTIKGLLWEEDGFMLITKRLENGKFQWPRTEEEVIALSEQELRWLLDGLSIVQKNAIRPARKRAYIV